MTKCLHLGILVLVKFTIHFITIQDRHMARCSICGKKTMSGNSRSHSNIATKRTFKVNIQTKRIDGKKTKVCTKCIKTMNKVSK